MNKIIRLLGSEAHILIVSQTLKSMGVWLKDVEEAEGGMYQAYALGLFEEFGMLVQQVEKGRLSFSNSREAFPAWFFEIEEVPVTTVDELFNRLKLGATVHSDAQKLIKLSMYKMYKEATRDLDAEIVAGILSGKVTMTEVSVLRRFQSK